MAESSLYKPSGMKMRWRRSFARQAVSAWTQLLLPGSALYSTRTVNTQYSQHLASARQGRYFLLCAYHALHQVFRLNYISYKLSTRHQKDALLSSLPQISCIVHLPAIMPPDNKKQQSLTSFFTPKTVNGLAASFEQQSRARKRPLDDADKANTRPEPSPKKPRASSPAPDRDSSARATRYLYTQSSDGDESTRHTNEDLHRRFVKKLGHPDALSLRARHTPQDDAAVDGDADDDDDEDSPPPAKTAKKSSKSGKLTPMEVQFLDIKRRHMDTILIVEVGYKFRFFGRDAQIAAKELSIVCMPGKMRYDERASTPSLQPHTLLTPVPRPLRGSPGPLRLGEHSRPQAVRPRQAPRRRRPQGRSCPPDRDGRPQKGGR